ncbi:cutinase/poly(ethylene terephthalate) hydrolase [Thermobifida cellulosilytica]|uniref:Poly(ethylene terephthalate) hydrolase n=1 Tax=Thermobifida cellulosilytica TB100 TaxID=665004 RepID=A0A147KJY8_THECS|nr:alpha/beta hydrolase [Thermobifida cellulosilytica]KUP97549.1 lipase [Thermobifida cellulosilytica TB100]
MSVTTPRRRTPLLSRVLRTAAVAATAAASVLALSAPAQAANPYERGPNPTQALLEARSGPFSVSSERAWRLGSDGFGGGTIYYPRENNTYGAVAISPGYTGTQASVAWLGERIASHGFVVITIDTNTTLDQPDSRARQLDAALDHMLNDASSAVRSRIDRNRLAVMGHSMGGGGTLRLASQRPDLKAAIPLTPWHLNKSWSNVQVPTLIIGADLDTIAPVLTHAEPFYNSIPTSTRKAYLELDGATHFAPNITNSTIGMYSVAWLKRFVDEDTRYTQFLCPGPRTGLFSDVEEYRSTCPF